MYALIAKIRVSRLVVRFVEVEISSASSQSVKLSE